MLSLRFQVDGYIKYVGLDLSTKLTILLLFYYESSWGHPSSRRAKSQVQAINESP